MLRKDMVYDKIIYYSLSELEKRNIIKKIKNILHSFDKILLSIVFGGFIERDCFRDIDILVYMSGKASLEEYLRITSILEDRIGYPVDLVLARDSPPTLIIYAIRNGIILFDKKGFLVDILYKMALDERETIENFLKLHDLGM